MLSGETAIGRDPPGSWRRWPGSPRGPSREASYRQWAERLGREQRTWDDDSSDRITAAVTHAAWQAAHDAGAAAILCCTRTGRTARAMARFRPAVPARRPVTGPADGQRAALSWGVEPVHVDEYHTSDEMVVVRRRDGAGARLHRARRHRARAGRRAGPPQRRGGRRAAHRASRVIDVVAGLWSEDDRSAGRRRWSCSSTARWTARPACSSCPAASTTTIACCATTAGATAARRPHPGPFGDGRPGRRPGRAPGRPSRPSCSGTATAATSRWRSPTAGRSWCGPSPCTRRRCRGWTGGRRRPPAAMRSTCTTATSPIPPMPPSGSCAG